jgi:F-type H+-transporting ATPase subunit b
MSPFVLASTFTDVKPGLIIWTWITFIIVVVVLRRFAWGPLLKAIDDREKNIVGAIESAKRERAEAEKLLAEQKSAIATARQEAAEQVRKTQADMEKFREELMGKARKEAEDLKVDARRSIEEERVKAVNDIKAEAVKLSIQIAEKLLSERLDDGKHQQLAQQFVTDLAKKGPQA